MVLVAPEGYYFGVVFPQVRARVGRVSTVYGRTTFPPSRI